MPLTPEQIARYEKLPVETMDCACCGGGCRCRQWYNRDTGYGICPRCGHESQVRDGEEVAIDYYGYEGIHWNINERKEP